MNTTTKTHNAQTDPVVNEFKAQSETCNKTHLARELTPTICLRVK